jgi:hypothetical protein
MSTHGLDTDMTDADADLFALAHAEDPGRFDMEEFHCPSQKDKRKRVRKDWKELVRRERHAIARTNIQAGLSSG